MNKIYSTNFTILEILTWMVYAVYYVQYYVTLYRSLTSASPYPKKDHFKNKVIHLFIFRNNFSITEQLSNCIYLESHSSVLCKVPAGEHPSWQTAVLQQFSLDPAHVGISTCSTSSTRTSCDLGTDTYSQ